MAVAAVLSLVVMSGRLARYISAAAEGQLALGLIFPVVFLRMPQLLEVILPASTLLAILFALGDLHEKNEMTAVHAAGVGHGRALGIGMAAAAVVALAVAALSFYISPLGNQQVGRLVAEQGASGPLSQLAPNRFYGLPQGGTLYVGQVERAAQAMERIFLHRPAPLRARAAESSSVAGRQTVVYAQRGYRTERAAGGFAVVLEDGLKFEGVPGGADFLVTEFARYRQQIEAPQIDARALTTVEESATLGELFGGGSAARAQLHWRLSLPLSVLLLAAIALPLSRSNPRQGRYYLLVPAMLLFLSYMALLNTGREAVASGQGGVLARIWGGHLGDLLFAVALNWPALWAGWRHGGGE